MTQIGNLFFQRICFGLALVMVMSGCARRRQSKSEKTVAQLPATSSSKVNPAGMSVVYTPLTPTPLSWAPAPATRTAEAEEAARERVAEGLSEQLRNKNTVEAAIPSSLPSNSTNVTMKKESAALEDRYVKVDFENEELSTVIQHFASLQRYNIILPQGSNVLSHKITFKLPYEIPLREVNRYIDFFLELIGYSRVPHGSFFRVVKNDAFVAREALPLYVGVAPEALPSSDERIRVIYYLKNLRVPETAQGTDPITIVLNDILSPSRAYLYDSRSNAIVISDKAINIKAALTLLVSLDAIGTKDILRAIPLYNTTAETMAQLLTTQILAAGGDDQQAASRDAGKYFAAGLRIQPDARTNSLIVMGREPAVERLQDFIRDYLDIPADSGSSILHMYPLQYLDAEKFAPILQKIVNEQGLGGSGQARQSSSAGPYRFFDGVVVVAEKIIAERVEEKKLSDKGTESVLKGTVYRGGNRILVTALSEDWKRVERIIKELDKPRLQIVLQTMIVDFDITNNNTLGAQTRNPSWMQLPPGVSFQAAHLAQPILDGALGTAPPPPQQYINPTTLAADLLRLLTGGLSAAGQLINSGANISNIGSTILSFNDTSPMTPGIWSFLQWLSSFGAVNVLSNPHIIVLNNSRGEELISQINRLPGPAETGEGGAIAIKQVDVEAALKVSIVPRASSVDRLSLQVSIIINQFVGTAGARTTREIHTNVNLNSGETLVIGGLTRYQESDTITETPILGRVPILRWLFSSTRKTMQKTNLVVFISPTIIEPRIREGQDQFSKDTIERNYNLLRNEEFAGQLKEPVNYLFFGSRNNEMLNAFDQYLAEGVGDFVFDVQKQSGQQTTHHCKQCPSPQPKEADEPQQANELKKALEGAENPLVAEAPLVLVQDTPEKGILNP